MRVLHLYLINKSSLWQCLERYQIVFEEELGQSFSAEQFVQQLEEGVSLLILLNHNERLLGMLLGYGYESPAAFQEVEEEQENYGRIQAACPAGCTIHPVTFMGDPHSEEVQQLVSVYESELEVIWESYSQSKNHLQWFLKQLCEN